MLISYSEVKEMLEGIKSHANRVEDCDTAIKQLDAIISIATQLKDSLCVNNVSEVNDPMMKSFYEVL